jgi:hypothetical protein
MPPGIFTGDRNLSEMFMREWSLYYLINSNADHPLLDSYHHHHSFPTMSSPPFSSFSSSVPSPPGFYEATTSEADLDWMLRERVRALMDEMDLDMEPLPSSLTGQQEPPSHSQEFSPLQIFNETSSPMPTPTPTGVTPVREVPPTLDPSQVPIGSKLAKKQSLLGHAKLSVFDILNTFQCHWFVSTDHLRTTVLSAQKAEDRKVSGLSSLPSFMPTWSSALLHLYLTPSIR